MKLYLIILSLFLINNSFSQKKANPAMEEITMKSLPFKTLLEMKYDKSITSKIETEKWILQKLNSYVITEFDEVGEAFPQRPGDYSEPIRNHYNYKMSSKNIYFQNNTLNFEFKYEVISLVNGAKTTKDDKVSIKVEDITSIENFNRNDLTFWYHTNSTGNDNIYHLRFNFENESDIFLRLKKAFLHLESFYWKRVSNEVF